MIDGLIRISKAGIWFSISGMLTVAFIYCIWGLGEDIFVNLMNANKKLHMHLMIKKNWYEKKETHSKQPLTMPYQ